MRAKPSPENDAIHTLRLDPGCAMAAARACILALTALLLGCSVLADPPVPVVPAAQSAPELYSPPIENEYTLQVGDQIGIRSYYDPQLNQDVTVRVDGCVSLLLLQDVDVVGKTPQELSSELSARYSDLVGASDILVSLDEMVSSSVYVGGEVRHQSEQPIKGPITLIQAITAAGGFLPTANTRQVLVLRRQDDGRFIAHQIDTNLVLINELPDLYLKRYDIVHVPLSQVGHVGRFVDQYINSIIPEALRFSVGYSWLNDTRGDDRGSIQLLAPP
jgi:protein involved in polysaccharide export with SLBB domain